MRILPPTLGVLALLALAAPAAAQTPPITASFTAHPEQPKLGETVILEATSVGGSVHDWDLDDDGAFDDATGAKVTTRFDTPGLHTVRLRTTNPLYGNSATAAREFSIEGEATPTPTATATPTSTPTATPTPTAVPNIPPVAQFDPECKRVGAFVLCTGHVTRQGELKRISAAPSRDPDGQIVRYEWDIGGDGVFEVDTGTRSYVEHTFEPRIGMDGRQRRVVVRVTDNLGATATASVTIDIRPAACVKSVKAGAFTLKSNCLRPTNTTRDGKKIIRYSTQEPIEMGGVAIVARNRKSVQIEVERENSGAQPRITGRDATISMAASGAPAVLRSGAFEWNIVGTELRGFAIDGNAKINGLKITGLAGPVKLVSGRVSAKVHVALPKDFGAPTSDKPIALGGFASAAAAKALRFSVPSASLGPIGLEKLDVSYDGVDLWEIEASLTLPPPAAVTINAGAGIRSNGNFHHAEAEARFNGGGIPIGGPVPVFLQRIKFRVEVKPKKSQCVPHVGIVDLSPMFEPILGKPLPPGLVTKYDAGVPTFAMCGEIGLTAGPTIGGAAAVRLDAGLGWATYPDRPWVLRAFGNLSLVEIPLAQASLAVHGDGYITIYGKFRWGIPKVASLSGGLNVEMLKTKFNASGRVDACLDFVDLCLGARAIVSSKGIAACLKVDLWLTDWNPGIGYKWGAAAPTLYFAGCDIGQYKVKINRARAAQAGAHSVDVAAGLPGTAMVFKGQGAPPRVTLAGPKGERISSPTDGSGKAVGPDYMVIEDPNTALTHVLLVKPSAGRWEVTTHEGSAPIVEVQAADGLKKPSVKAKVRGRGRTRELHYELDAQPGQKVTFVERGGGAGGEIGVARGREGVLRFTPADGAKGKRSIVALVEQDGQVRAEDVVAGYVAPKPSGPARVRGLRVRRGVARWQKPAGAVSYEVQVRLADGRTTVQHTRKRTVRVPRTGRVRVAVRPIGANGMVGPRAVSR